MGRSTRDFRFGFHGDLMEKKGEKYGGKNFERLGLFGWAQVGRNEGISGDFTRVHPHQWTKNRIEPRKMLNVHGTWREMGQLNQQKSGNVESQKWGIQPSNMGYGESASNRWSWEDRIGQKKWGTWGFGDHQIWSLNRGPSEAFTGAIGTIGTTWEQMFRWAKLPCRPHPFLGVQEAKRFAKALFFRKIQHFILLQLEVFNGLRKTSESRAPCKCATPLGF